jgi:carboxypeptidase T
MVENYSKVDTDNDDDGVINEDPIDGFDNDGDGFVDEDPSEDRVRRAINNTQIFLIPMINPDGVEANTRKNCVPNYGIFGFRKKITSIGVDLNRNYGYLWNLKYLLPFKYKTWKLIIDFSIFYSGEKPFSQNETKALKQFAETHNLSLYMSYHTWLGCVNWAWWGLKPKKDKIEIYSIAENVSKINKYKVIPDFDNKTSILPQAVGPSGIWMYGKHNIFSFVIELGYDELAPTDPEIVFNMCKNHTGVNLYLCERALLL